MSKKKVATEEEKQIDEARINALRRGSSETKLTASAEKELKKTNSKTELKKDVPPDHKKEDPKEKGKEAQTC